MAISDCSLVNVPRVSDPRGNLSFIEPGPNFPFSFERVYYLYDVPGGSERGGHAHRKLKQFLIAMSGSFDVHLDDGKDKKTYHLNRPYFGLYICPMTWRRIDNFSSGSVCMVIASERYEEEDYIRDYSDFMSLRWSKPSQFELSGRREAGGSFANSRLGA